MNDKIRINLHMVGTTYPVTIAREDEQRVREAAKRVNMRFNLNQQENPDVSPEKIIAMTAFEFALLALDQQERNDTEPYKEKIKELTEVLDEHFRETAEVPNPEGA